MIFDTDVLIWVTRGNERAKNLVESTFDKKISAVTYMELMQGARNKVELAAIEKFLTDSNFKILNITESITKSAISFVREFTLSDSMEMPDALIAATCISEKESLCTANYKHYKCIENLKINVFKVA